jgi:hypothetical protein
LISKTNARLDEETFQVDGPRFVGKVDRDRVALEERFWKWRRKAEVDEGIVAKISVSMLIIEGNIS